MEESIPRSLTYPIMVLSDLHAHERHGRQRVQELKALFSICGGLVASLDLPVRPTLVVTGDMYDRNAPLSVDTTLLFADFFKLFGSVFIIVGNHDTPIRSTLTALPDIYKMMGVHIIKQTTQIEDCLFVPYFDSLVPAQMGNYRYVFAHKDIKELNQYCDPEYGVSITDFPPARAVFNGHLHSNGAYTHGSGVFIQVGAPYPTSWADKYDLNRYTYMVYPESHQAYYTLVTADAGAEDADRYAFQRSRSDKAAAGEAETEHEVILQGLQALRDDDLTVDAAMRLLGNGVDRRTANITKGILRHAPAQVKSLSV